MNISILAPSRERPAPEKKFFTSSQFQSSLPRGSDCADRHVQSDSQDFNPRSLAGATSPPPASPPSGANFNPRSLAGATKGYIVVDTYADISILAPSRERPCGPVQTKNDTRNFNPRSLAGATNLRFAVFAYNSISILAPSRERPVPCSAVNAHLYFNPRSLAGATPSFITSAPLSRISILAPSRERLSFFNDFESSSVFQSSLPRGSDDNALLPLMPLTHFNPRSLAGATLPSVL